mmetsp:Transcript_46141/g.76882  ORF Transcript_46141/g.76882 Transcript_46141/m.76882 type:complete len:283 (-) Transcript_46141:14-862(-)
MVHFPAPPASARSSRCVPSILPPPSLQYFYLHTRYIPTAAAAACRVQGVKATFGHILLPHLCLIPLLGRIVKQLLDLGSGACSLHACFLTLVCFKQKSGFACISTALRIASKYTFLGINVLLLVIKLCISLLGRSYINVLLLLVVKLYKASCVPQGDKEEDRRRRRYDEREEGTVPALVANHLRERVACACSAQVGYDSEKSLAGANGIAPDHLRATQADKHLRPIDAEPDAERGDEIGVEARGHNILPRHQAAYQHRQVQHHHPYALAHCALERVLADEVV